MTNTDDDRRVVADLVQRCRRDERGSGYLAAFIVLFSVLVFGGVMILVGSAQVVAARRQATSAAFESARAGAQAVSVASVRDGMFDVVSVEGAVRQAATTLAEGTGAVVTDVQVVGDEVVVTVRQPVHPLFPLLGVDSVSETGRAQLVLGIEEEGQ